MTSYIVPSHYDRVEIGMSVTYNQCIKLFCDNSSQMVVFQILMFHMKK